jgi:hypothetical protein
VTTLTVTLDFSSDDGTAEEFVAYYGSSWPDGSYDGSEGNPSGSVTSAVSYPDGGLTLIGISKTIEAWGVPAGATINSVGNLQADYKAHKTGSYAYPNYPLAELRKGTGLAPTIEANYPPDPYEGAWDTWASLPNQDVSDQSPYTTSTIIQVGIALDGTADVSGSGLQLWYDNITFDIDYTAGADVELSGSTTLPSLSGTGTLTFSGIVLRGSTTIPALLGDGTLTFTDVDVRLIGSSLLASLAGTGGLSLDDELLLYGQSSLSALIGYGSLFSAITGEVAAPAPAGTRYTLTLDGIEYQMVRAVVTRSGAAETAKATLPGAYMAGIVADGPTALVISVLRVLADGSGTDVATLFSGTIDLSATTISRETGELVANGSASWPARANRQLQDAPSYVRDSAESTSVRGQIDPLLVPGDVLRFSGVREIPVSRVVYSVSSDLQFMEASSGL